MWGFKKVCCIRFKILPYFFDLGAQIYLSSDTYKSFYNLNLRNIYKKNNYLLQVGKLVHAIKMGWLKIKKPKKPEESQRKFYDIWDTAAKQAVCFIRLSYFKFVKSYLLFITSFCLFYYTRINHKVTC